jgi:uncharacterized radical SAM superfamily Fe-S cluster-containing enzyme
MSAEPGNKSSRQETTTPNPGSDEARRLGCLCPIVDNNHGQGMWREGGRQFWINSDCPMHGKFGAI